MTFSDILPTIQALPRSQKLHLIRMLAADIAREEGLAQDISGATVPIWSPYDSYEGAEVLMRMLAVDGDSPTMGGAP
ncbi:MAG: hypothetical protein JNL67_02780 [Planctomycetaceae bacterium]|nr:hypothetical protein [Planctomycetaceae bacterium]